MIVAGALPMMSRPAPATGPVPALRQEKSATRGPGEAPPRPAPPRLDPLGLLLLREVLAPAAAEQARQEAAAPPRLGEHRPPMHEAVAATVAAMGADGDAVLVISMTVPGGGSITSLMTPAQLSGMLASDDPGAFGSITTADGRTHFLRDMLLRAIGAAAGATAVSPDPEDELGAALAAGLRRLAEGWRPWDGTGMETGTGGPGDRLREITQPARIALANPDGVTLTVGYLPAPLGVREAARAPLDLLA